MKERTRFVEIKSTVAFGARDRLLDDLNKLTDGNAYMAIDYVTQFLELEKICEEFEKEKKEKKEEEEEEILPFTPDEIPIDVVGLYGYGYGSKCVGINKYGEVVKSCDDNTTLPHKILNDFNKGIH